MDNYKHYGGRGIKVCEEWKSFEAFNRDMGATFQKHLQIERKNVNGNYERLYTCLKTSCSCISSRGAR